MLSVSEKAMVSKGARVPNEASYEITGVNSDSKNLACFVVLVATSTSSLNLLQFVPTSNSNNILTGLQLSDLQGTLLQEPSVSRQYRQLHSLRPNNIDN